MGLRIVAGSAGVELAGAVAARLGVDPVPCELERFPDGEIRPVVGAVQGDDVFVLQPTAPPVHDNLMELLLLLDAARRAGAGRVTAVVPYLAYARQDRRGRVGEPVGARVVADLVAAAGAERMIVLDPHTTALEAAFRIPVEILSASGLLASALAPDVPEDAVVVAPDIGALKLAERYASQLRRPVAVVHKTRLTGATVRAEATVGDVAGRKAIIVDDMIGTGGTVEAALRVLLDQGADRDVMVAATHAVLAGAAIDRLARLPLRRIVVTDSTGRREPLPAPFTVVGVAPLLADAVRRLHRGAPEGGQA